MNIDRAQAVRGTLRRCRSIPFQDYHESKTNAWLPESLWDRTIPGIISQAIKIHFSRQIPQIKSSWVKYKSSYFDTVCYECYTETYISRQAVVDVIVVVRVAGKRLSCTHNDRKTHPKRDPVGRQAAGGISIFACGKLAVTHDRIVEVVRAILPVLRGAHGVFWLLGWWMPLDSCTEYGWIILRLIMVINSTVSM